MRGKRIAGKRKHSKCLRRTMAAAMMSMSVLCTGAIPTAVLGAMLTLGYINTAWAMEAGSYLVTVTPSYTDPETGKVEDPGNNEAIGQGMTQKLCGPQGLLEVDASGNMYLTVRYYLSQFVSDVSFEERSGGSYTTCSYQKMQVKDPVSGAANLDDKYGYTDYRIPIQSLSSVFRGKAYIEPMGRSVVYFFQASGPTAGSGDFVTSIQTDVPAETEPEVREAAETANEEPEIREKAETADEEPEPDWRREEELQGPENDTVNGSGDADAPVTGIPEKPSAARIGGIEAGATSDTEEDYHLQTKYDLSAVPVEEARKLTEPMLEAAAGVTLMVGERSGAAVSDADIAKDSDKNINESIMYVLLGLSALLLIRFMAAFISSHKRSGRGQEAEMAEEEMASAQDEIERRKNRR